MNLRSVVALPVVALAIVACGPQVSPSGTDGTWVGTITTEGDVTTVVNEAGSVWGGTATLVEEASIGVAEGENGYMLGLVRAVAASHERIYVLDSSALIVRAYTLDGEYVAAEERDAAIAESTAFMRMRGGDSWTWDGPEVPWIKPARSW